MYCIVTEEHVKYFQMKYSMSLLSLVEDSCELFFCTCVLHIFSQFALQSLFNVESKLCSFNLVLL